MNGPKQLRYWDKVLHFYMQLKVQQAFETQTCFYFPTFLQGVN